MCIWYRTGYGNHLSSDTHSYYSIARSLSAGEGYKLDGVPSARRPPGYPFLLVPFIKLNFFPFGVQLLQALIGALSCFFLYQLTKSIFGDPAAILAALLMAVDYSFIRLSAVVLPESLFILLILLYLFFLMRYVRGGRIFFLILSGAFAGFCMLTKDTLMFYFPVVAVWLAIRKSSIRFASVKSAVLFLSIIFLTLLPWNIRNLGIFNEAVLTTPTLGHTLYVANNPYATGGRTGGDWEWNKDSYLPPDPARPPLLTPEADRYLLNQALGFIVHHPRHFLKLAALKAFNMWRPYQTDSPSIAKWLTALSYVPVILLGLVGLFRHIRRWFELFPLVSIIGYVFLLHSVMIAHIRYRYPVMPVFMLLAAQTLISLWKPKTFTPSS